MENRDSLLRGLVVLDLSGTLAGVYTGRLLADAGARVMRIHDRRFDLGDPGTGYSVRARDALGRVLTAGHEQIGDVESGLAQADAVIVSDETEAIELAGYRRSRPEVVVVALTDYGLDGPWAGRRATSQLRQAQSGSTSSRGVPEFPPLAAAGETEQFLAGAYAAAAVVTALMARESSGAGDLIDLSLLEVSNLGQTLFGTTQASMRGRLGEDFPHRSIQVPANERTADGWVGLCTISARQRQDLLLVVGREDLADDESHAYGNDHPEVDAEIRRSVEAWASTQSTREVIELASALRIPVSPLTTGATMTENEQLIARGFLRQGEGGLLSPGAVFRYTRNQSDRLDPPRRQPQDETGAGPLSGIRVVDLTAWWAGPSATHFLAAQGADVVKVESAAHPDGMRYSFVDDPSTDLWWERGPVYYAINTNKRGIALDLRTAKGREVLTELLLEADMLVENFTPRVLDSMGLDWKRILTDNPGLVTVRMPAFGLDGPWRDRTGFAQTIEQSCGLAWITGHPKGAPIAPRGVCDPLAGIHAAFAGLAALRGRHETGLGGLVEVSMFEPAVYAAFGQSLAWQLDGSLVERIGNRHHRHSPHGVYATSVSEEWVCVAVRTDDEWRLLAGALDVDELRAADFDSVGVRVREADRIDAAIHEWMSSRDASEAVRLLGEAGVPAARVDGSGQLLDNPQLGHRHYFEYVDHPVAGRHPIPSLPFRVENQKGQWNRAPAPTLGEHTGAVLREWLGMPPAEIDALFEEGVSGYRPANLDGD